MDFFSQFSWYTVGVYVCASVFVFSVSFASLIYLSAQLSTKFIFALLPGRKCDDDGDKDDEHRYVSIALCVRVCVCLYLRAYVYLSLSKIVRIHLFTSICPELHLLFIIMEFRQIHCEISASAELRLAISFLFLLKHCLCSPQTTNQQQQPDFKRFWCVTVHARVFFFVSIFTALSTLHTHTTHATVEFVETYSVARLTFTTQGNVNTFLSDRFLLFYRTWFCLNTQFLFQSQVYRASVPSSSCSVSLQTIKRSLFMSM